MHIFVYPHLHRFHMVAPTPNSAKDNTRSYIVYRNKTSDPRVHQGFATCDIGNHLLKDSKYLVSVDRKDISSIFIESDCYIETTQSKAKHIASIMKVPLLVVNGVGEDGTVTGFEA